jgi:TM2 domain-containing membrane protein YozV
MALMYCRECGKQVSSEAYACPHCGAPHPTGMALAAPQPVYVRPPPPATFSPGAAAVLSFFLPGLGQICKGEVGPGIGWMFATLIGYCMFIVPGLILHICCVVNAGKSTAWRKY